MLEWVYNPIEPWATPADAWKPAEAQSWYAEWCAGEMPWTLTQKREQQELGPEFEMYRNAGMPCD